MTAPRDTIAVLGAGSWGTALAIVLARNGQPTTLWTWESDHGAEMSQARENRRFLPGHRLPAGLTVSAERDVALSGARDVLLVVPSHAFRQVLDDSKPFFDSQVRVAWATKGFEPGSGRLLHQVVSEVLGPTAPAAVLSGPTFALEVAKALPTAITVAATDADFAADLAARFHSDRLRVYTSKDIVGVQVGGAVKNVLAIAAGIADGLGFGANTRAALITRGLAELMRLGVAMGGAQETFMGLAGLGDLVLTCTDDQSRNRRLGLALAEGKSADQAQAEIGQAVEGVVTTREVMRLAEVYAVDMPIAEQVSRVLHEGLAPSQAVRDLLARAAGPEVR